MAFDIDPLFDPMVTSAGTGDKPVFYQDRAMHLIINGEDHKGLPDGMSVSDLIAHLELPAGKIAVERNREVVPKSQHAETKLQDGDVLEIIHFIGGG